MPSGWSKTCQAGGGLSLGGPFPRFHLLKNIVVFPRWFLKESITTENVFIFYRGLN